MVAGHALREAAAPLRQTNVFVSFTDLEVPDVLYSDPKGMLDNEIVYVAAQKGMYS